MPLDIISYKDRKLSDSKMRVLLYGEAGAGKTHLLRDFPKPMLVIDFDGKCEPLYGVDGIDILEYKLQDVKDATKVFMKFKKDFGEIKKMAGEYKTIAFDSLTSYDVVCVRHFVLLSGKPAEDKATLPVYGELNGWYQYFITELKSVDSNVVMLAHAAISIDDLTKQMVCQPLITGNKIQAFLPSQFKDLWYLEMNKKGERVLHYKKSGIHPAASLTLKGDGSIIEPTYSKILQEIEKNEE